MLLILVVGLQIVLPVLLSFALVERSGWSRQKIVLITALPMPVLVWGASLIMLALMLFDPDQQYDEGIHGYAFAAAVTAVAGATLYILGAVLALIGLQFKKRPPKEDLDKIFK